MCAFGVLWLSCEAPAAHSGDHCLWWLLTEILCVSQLRKSLVEECGSPAEIGNEEIVCDHVGVTVLAVSP